VGPRRQLFPLLSRDPRPGPKPHSTCESAHSAIPHTPLTRRAASLALSSSLARLPPFTARRAPLSRVTQLRTVDWRSRDGGRLMGPATRLPLPPQTGGNHADDWGPSIIVSRALLIFSNSRPQGCSGIGSTNPRRNPRSALFLPLAGI
jgi:hypothetical protein